MEIKNMNREDIANKAVDLKLHGYNCTQAVLLALKDECNLDEDTLKNLGGSFCAGMGNMKATCGALIAANMVNGLYSKGDMTLVKAKNISENFEKRSKALVCKDLKALTNGKPLCPCTDCVRNAVYAYFDVIHPELG